jgi:two-component SAPR family response regulator
MITPFSRCLLIDDNPLDNFINTLLIIKAKFAHEVISCESSEDALLKLSDGSIKPDVIFLDLNMPVINGFQFLSKYANLNIIKENIKIFVLSSSLNPADLHRAENDPNVTKFIEKVLTWEKLHAITNTYCITPDCMSIGVDDMVNKLTA